MSHIEERDRVAERTRPKVVVKEKSAFSFDDPRHDEGIGDLLRRLAHQGAHLAEKQTELVRAEVRSSLQDLKVAAGEMAGAAVLGMAGLGVTLMGLSFLLAEAIGLWPATLIVGVAALIGAYAMYAAAKEKLQSQSMSIERTRDTIERAPKAMSGDEEEKING